jgi:hypothetical protein
MNKTYKIEFLKTVAFIAFISMLPEAVYGQVQVSYFGHAGYTAKFDDNLATKTQSAFNSGGVDILLTSEITDRLSVLGELFTGFRGDGSNSVALSLERLYFKYAVNDYVNVRLGRMYTPLSFWQGRYSQAQFFQPTINAPYAVRTKFDKGILPTNSVGLQIDGENIGKVKFSYYFMIDNTSASPSLNTDNTDFKAVTAKLKFEPIENVQLYASGRTDKIIEGSTSLQGRLVAETTDQTILNVGMVHIAPDAAFEFAFDYFHVTNETASLGQTGSDFMYGYVGYKIKKIVPYVQWDVLSYDPKDQYFDNNDLRGLIIGTRYNIAPTAVIKLEYKYRGTDVINHQDVISLQVAARF